MAEKKSYKWSVKAGGSGAMDQSTQNAVGTLDNRYLECVALII